MKLKLIELFKDHEGEKVLSEDEIFACLEYMSKYIKPFHTSKIKRDLLNVLIRKSKVVEMESDEAPFIHNADILPDHNINERRKLTQTQIFYNQIKNKDMSS
jgi:hypothetical protein